MAVAPTLSGLLGELAAEEFMAHYWPLKPFYVGSTGPLLRQLCELEFLDDVARLVEVYPGAISLLSRTDGARECVDPNEAIAAVELGWTCYLRRIHEFIPELGAIAQALASELGTDDKWISAEFFWSRAPSGVAMHSDYDANLALLLAGTKTWKLAANEHVLEQPGVCLAKGNPQPDPTVALLTEGVDLPASMPADAKIVTAEARTALFVPRGWWHETVTAGSAVQVNFVVKGPSLRDLAFEAIQEASVSDERWRRFAYGHAAREDSGRVQLEVSRLLREVSDQMDNGQDPRT